MRLGLGLSLSSVSGSGAVTPEGAVAALSLTGWWRAPFTASPWVGVASAGTSGTHNASHATNAPDVGAALNGFNTADFEAANLDFLDTAVLTTMFAADGTQGSCAFLINIESRAADDASVFLESNIFTCSTPRVMLVASTSGIRAGLFDGAWKATAKQALANATWGLAQMRWNSTNLESRVNSGAWQTVAAGTPTILTGTVQLGRSTQSVNFFDGLMADAFTAATRFSDADFDKYKTYVNTRYGLAL